MDNRSADGFGLPGLPSVTEGFGFSVSAPNMQGVEAALQQSQSVVDNLRGIISNGITNAVANGAVTADILNQQTVQHMQGVLGNAADTLINLQQPINQQIISKLGTTLERTIPLGINVPIQDQATPLPSCVMIHDLAKLGDLMPALQYYISYGGNLGLPLTDAQIQARQFLQRCLYDLPEQWGNLLVALQEQDLHPARIGQFTPGGRTTSGQDTSDQVGQTDVVNMLHTPPPNVGNVGLPGQLPVNPIGATTLGPNGTIIPALRPNPFPYSLDWRKPTIGPFDVCKEIAKIGPDAMKVWADGWPDTNSTFVGYVQVATPLGLPGAPPGTGSPECIIQVYPATKSTGGQWAWNATGIAQNSPLCGAGICGVGPLPPPPPPYCPPPNCPPPPPPICCPPPNITVNVDTQKKREETKKTEDTPPVCKYQLYCTTDDSGTLLLYAVKDGEPPHEASDKLLASGDPAEWMVYDAANKCGTKITTGDAQEGYGSGILPFPIALAGCKEFGAIPGVQLPYGLGSISQLIGLRNADGSLWRPYPDGDGPPIASAIANFITTFFVQGLDSVTSVINAFVTQSGCANGQQLALVGADVILKLWQQWAGGSLDFLTIPNDQQRHFLCPTMLPGKQEAAVAYLGNQIDKSTLECWTRADNGRWPEFATVVDAQRSKLSAQQMAIALRRGLIGQVTYDDYIRESGYIRNFEPQLHYDLTAQIPAPTDIARFMVRDTADEGLVTKFKLDDQFGKKFNGQLKQWASDQGVDELYMKYIWRAHWSIPAPGQLANMLHRLSRKNPIDPAYVDLDIIRTAMNQQDIAPFWVDKFIATSYSPLTRIDARRAYEIGAMTDQQLTEAYLNLGYDSANADTLLQFNKKNIARTFMRRPEIKEVAAGAINNSEFDQTMTMFGATDTIIQQGFQYAQLLRKKNTRKSCVKALRKRFMGGDLSVQESIQALQAQGLQPETAQDITDGWACERHATSKTISAAQAVSLYQDGLITESDLARRLQNVGYSNDDSIMLVRQQARRLGIKVAKDELTAMRQAQAEQAKMARQLEAQTAKAEVKQRRDDANARKMRTITENREKRLIEAALLFSQHSGIDAPSAVQQIKALYNAVLAAYTVTYDEAIQAILLATQDKQLTTLTQIREAVATALLQIG